MLRWRKQGKVKKTRRFAEVKRMLNPADIRLKQNQKKAEEKEKKEKEKEVRHVWVSNRAGRGTERARERRDQLRGLF